jgi:WD40 repeat protein
LTETSSGEEIVRIQHQGAVSEVIFSPDSRYLATRSNDGTATLVEVSTGREVARIRHEGDVSQVAFSPDGRYLATAGGNDVYVLPLDIEELFARVCARLTRNLTHQEWNRYIGSEVSYHATCPNLPVPEE